MIRIQRASPAFGKAVEQVGLIEQTQIVLEDGRAAVWNEALKAPELRTWTVHIDPFDAFGSGASGGPSAVELARRMADRGAVVCYWYGYEDPAHEAWAWDEIAKAVQPKVQFCCSLERRAARQPSRRRSLTHRAKSGNGCG